MNEDTTTQGTPLVPEGMQEVEEAELHLPTNEEVLGQQDGTGEGNEDPAKTEDEEGDGAGAGDDASNVDKAETPVVQYETVDDPGEFVPGDYTFEVTVYDDQGANPKVHKIANLDQWDALLETEPNLGSSAAVLRAERAAQKMDRGIERDRSVWETRKAEYDEAVKQQQEIDSRTIQWQSELDYLVGKGELPPMPAEFHVSKANWKDPNVAKQPAVKAQLELLDYFKKENEIRVKAGLTPMTSLLDAYNGFARERDAAAVKQNRTQAATDRKAAGARVASSSPRPATSAPRGVAIGRVGVLD